MNRSRRWRSTFPTTEMEPIRASAWEQLRLAGVTDCAGPIWLQTFPRLFGYLFNPVSFWYCQRGDGAVGAIAEVNNTFGERHLYLLTPDRSAAALAMFAPTSECMSHLSIR